VKPSRTREQRLRFRFSETLKPGTRRRAGLTAAPIGTIVPADQMTDSVQQRADGSPKGVVSLLLLVLLSLLSIGGSVV